MSRQTSPHGPSSYGPSFGHRVMTSLKVLAASSFLALGGCSFADEVLWPAVSGDDVETSQTQTQNPPPLGDTQISGLSVGTGATSNTAVGQKVSQIRSELASLQSQIEAHSARLEQVRAETRAHAEAYHTTKAGIEAKLQVGTTPGNPQLVQAWNLSQSQLDQIARDVNNMTSLSNEIAGDAATSNYLLDTTQATFGLSGAVDQDHRQLERLQVDTNQTVVLINKLLSELRQDIARQTTYLANERSNLTTLSNAIKRGQLFGRPLASGVSNVAAQPVSAGRSNAIPSGTPPLVVIRFDRPDVEYERALYTALSQALERRPASEFTVLAVAAGGGSAGNAQLAQSQSRKNAEKVFQSMSDMGLPADRVQISSTTSADVSTNEVRIFVR